ncbi:MAG: hypothetical protein ACKVJ2_15290 [Pseudomonadales bacterium]
MTHTEWLLCPDVGIDATGTIGSWAVVISVGDGIERPPSILDIKVVRTRILGLRLTGCFATP